ncbi:hypothetical protein [Streptomyces sp. NPDC058572]|uniref:hypothetical protein n=1 Tax=Streptomyces sp. NPDC058572 TaxID=3346546 RepID=UPI003659895C
MTEAPECDAPHSQLAHGSPLADAERAGGPAEFKAPELLPADVAYAARRTATGTVCRLRGAGGRSHPAGGVSGGTSVHRA